MENTKYKTEDSDLRKFQLRMLEILKVVDKICRKHNIPYWLSCGTLLGAVRHKGFIPWDDDMDIEVKKEDYKRLLKVLMEELPEEYVVHNFKTDKAFFFQFTKVRDLNSSMKEDKNVDIDYKYKGAFIDIFPMEYVSATAAALSNKVFMFTFKIMNFLRLKKVKGRSFIIYLLHIFVLIITFICRVLSLKSRNKFFSSLCLDFSYKIEEDELYPLQEIKFENYNFLAPNKIDVYLKSYFGDNYMVLPEEKNRIWHGSDFKTW